MRDYKVYLPMVYKFLIFGFIGLVLYYIGLPLLVILLPFIIATLIAFLMEPMVSFMQRRLKLKRSLSSLLSLIAVLLGFLLILSLIIYKIVIELVKLSNAIPVYFKSINLGNEIKYWNDLGQRFYVNVPPEASSLMQTKLNDTIVALSKYLTDFISSALSFSFDAIKYLPQILIFTIITALSTYFISSDREKIREFVLRQFNESWRAKLTSIKNDLFFAFVGFLKAQLIVIAISIFVISTGLTILGVEYSITLGILIGSAEILPIVGIGTILLPWIIYNLVTKNTFLAIGLACVYLIGLIARHSTESRIIGAQIGVYPLVTLISMYVGLNLFGVVGVILGPITVIILRNLNRSGIIHLWKE